MPSAKGLECLLVVAGHPVEEYGTIVEDNFVSTYVIAAAHENFYISVVTTEFVHEGLEIYVYIDGKYQTSSTWPRLAPDNPVDAEYHGKRVRKESGLGVGFERPWKFDDLIEADSDGDNDDDEEESNIGMIEVVVLRYNEKPRIRRDRRPRAFGIELNDPSVEPHPHSKKYWRYWETERKRVINRTDVGAVCKRDIKKHNLSNRVTVGDEEMVEEFIFDEDQVFLDSFEKPYCIFVMKYRSRSVLVSLDYISISPVSSRASSPAIDLEELKALSKEEMLEELVRYKKMVGGSTKRVKPESPNADESWKSSKRSRVRKETSLCPSDQFVDLTGD